MSRGNEFARAIEPLWSGVDDPLPPTQVVRSRLRETSLSYMIQDCCSGTYQRGFIGN